jgi:hypothetical protein
MAELVQYTRQGEPEFHGITCPEGLTTEKLINSVFFIPGESTEPYAACPAGDVTQRVLLQDPAIRKTDSRQPVIAKSSSRGWGNGIKGINCDERTAIDPWYERYEGPSIRLVATRILFFGPDNRRCQALAIPDLRSTVCTSEGLFVLGFKGKDQSLVIQRFSTQGQLMTETEVAGIPSGALAGYQEDNSGITVQTAKMDQSGYADCYSSFVDKRNVKNLTGNTRLGPPDGPLQLAECMRPR